MEREPRTRARLDQPRDVRRGLTLPQYDPELFGRLSERVARFLGTWRFIGYMSLFIALWILWNIVAPSNWSFDTYGNKFTLLTLLLSLQASYAAPLILLAQNRQADRDRVQAEEDRARAASVRADTEYLARELASLRIAVGDLATRDFIRGELSRLLEADGDEEKREKKAKKRRERALTGESAGDRHHASD